MNRQLNGNRTKLNGLINKNDGKVKYKQFNWKIVN